MERLATPKKKTPPRLTLLQNKKQIANRHRTPHERCFLSAPHSLALLGRHLRFAHCAYTRAAALLLPTHHYQPFRQATKAKTIQLRNNLFRHSITASQPTHACLGKKQKEKQNTMVKKLSPFLQTLPCNFSFLL